MDGQWKCAACRARNMAQADACRSCGAARSVPQPTARFRALAVLLSGLLPGLGQLYQGRWVRGVLMLLVPPVAVAAITALVLVADPAARFVVREAHLAVLLVIGGLFAYHITVVLDAFAAGRRPRPLGLRALAYAFLAIVAVVLGGVYGAAYQQATAWATVVTETFAFEPEPPRLVPPPPFREEPPPPQWNGTDRLNVLLLGIDRRGDASETLNTDTVMVLSLDPINRTAAMLSIPRDTFVTIPGEGRDKINAAYSYGGAERGPELARRSVEELLQIPIHSHALIDFDAFTKVVDSFGGVLVDVRRPLRDEQYPTANFGVERLQMHPGPQLMDGSTALKYARSRHDSDDFKRASRQQDIIAALRVRLGQGGLARIPALLERVGPAVQTSFDPANVLPLARTGVSLDGAAIRSEVLLPCGVPNPHCELNEEISRFGYYLIPDRARIAELVAALFYDPRVRQEAARVEVRGAGARATAVAALAERLKARAYSVAAITEGERAPSAIVLRNAAKRHSANVLASLLGVGVEMAVAAEPSEADIIVRLGAEFRGLN